MPRAARRAHTEGGLDVTGQKSASSKSPESSKERAFASPCSSSPTRSHRSLGRNRRRQIVELHTGTYCEHASTAMRKRPTRRNRPPHGERQTRHTGGVLRCTPAMASPTTRWPSLARMHEIVELNIGHFIMGERCSWASRLQCRKCARQMDLARPRPRRGVTQVSSSEPSCKGERSTYGHETSRHLQR